MKQFNVSLGKEQKEIFGLKTGDMPSSEVSPIIQPVKEVQPYLNIVRIRTTTGTIYTTPSDSDFYLTNVFFDELGIDTDTIAVVLADGTTQTFYNACTPFAVGLNGVNQISINFPMRGILLAKNSAITCVMDNAGMTGISGYTQETLTSS